MLRRRKKQRVHSRELLSSITDGVQCSLNVGGVDGDLVTKDRLQLSTVSIVLLALCESNRQRSLGFP